MVSKRRKALIISYVWPPMEGVGLLRATKFAKYLPEFGWEPYVLTAGLASASSREADGAKVFRTGYRDVIEGMRGFFVRKGGSPEGLPPEGETCKAGGCYRRRPSLIREIVSMPDDKIGWYGFAVKEGRRVVAEEKIDVIISTSPPETAHLVARSLKKGFGLPWVADLRDLWADDHFRQRPFIKTFALRRMERDVLKDADSVITVSEPWAAVLRSSLKASAARVDVVENGFDEDDFSGTSYGRNDRLIISYTGKLHRERQPVDALFRVLRNLIREKRIDRERIEVRFYVMGYDKPDIAGLALSYGLEGVVVELGKVSYVRSLEIQRASDAVLFVQWNGIGGDGWYSAKLYDYIGSRRPIIALASGQGIVADLILRTSSGVVASSESDIRRELIRLYDEHRSSGSVRYQGDEDHISRLSRRERALELARILESLTAGNRSRASLERQVV